MEEFSGGCLCGDVRFTATGRPNRVGVCHCQDCRKHHGAMFYAAAIYPEDTVTIEGEVGDFAGRCFCQRCGSSVFARSGGEIELHLGCRPSRIRNATKETVRATTKTALACDAPKFQTKPLPKIIA